MASVFTSIIPDAISWEHVLSISHSQLPSEQDTNLRIRASVDLPSLFVSNKIHFGEICKAKESSFSSIFLFLAVSVLNHLSVSLLLMATLRAVLSFSGSCVFLPWVKSHIPAVNGQSNYPSWELALESHTFCHGVKHTARCTLSMDVVGIQICKFPENLCSLN